MEADVFRLMLGFDKNVPETQARAAAAVEWAKACHRHGWRPAGEPTTTVIRDDPEREAMGEYAVRVEGRKTTVGG